MAHVVRITNPTTVCVICNRPQEDCYGDDPGPHIYDGIRFPYVVVDDHGIVLSMHFTEEHAAADARARV